MSAPIANPGDLQSAQACVEALASKECDENEFERVAHKLIRQNQDAGWDLLSLLDQYFRRGKIKAEVFRQLKWNLEGLLLDTADIKAAAVAQKAESISATGLTAPVIGSSARSAAHPLAIGPPVASTATTANVLPTAAIAASTRAPGPRATEQVAIGDTLRSRYEIINVIGRGGMSTIFEAVDRYRLELPNLSPRVAIKILHSDVTKRPELLTELRREFQHLQSLSHPNIVRVHEYDRDGDIAFFTMEYLGGLTLSGVMAARHQVALNRSDALPIFRDVGAALAHAHRHGVVHGDLNPANIFVTHEGEVRVLDFGASQTLHRGPWISDIDGQTHIATPRYASCQLLEGEPADLRDDLYALACVAYLLLTGKHPFGDHTAIQARTLGLRPSRPAGLTRQQWRVLRSSLSFERQRRPANVDAVLEPFALGSAAARLPALLTLLKVTATEKPRKVWPALGAVAVLVLIAGWWFTTNDNPVDSAVSAWNTAMASLGRLRQGAAVEPAVSAPAAATPHSATAAAAVPAEAVNAAPQQNSAAAVAPAEPTASQPGSSGPRSRSRIEIAADNFEVPPDAASARVVIRRSGDLRSEMSFSWWTESGTAIPGRDFEPVAPHVEHIASGKGAVSIFIPVLTDSTRQRPRNFYVVIGESSSNASLGARTVAMVSIEPSS